MYKAKMRELQAAMDASTPASCSDGDDGAKGNIKPEKRPAAAGEPTSSPLLPTPSPSNLETPYSDSDNSKVIHLCEDIPVTTSVQAVYVTPRRWKRRRAPEAEDGEQRPGKRRATTTDANQDAIRVANPPCGPPPAASPNSTAHNENPRSKKRQRDPEADNEQQEQQRSTKIRIAATGRRPRNRPMGVSNRLRYSTDLEVQLIPSEL